MKKLFIFCMVLVLTVGFVACGKDIQKPADTNASTIDVNEIPDNNGSTNEAPTPGEQGHPSEKPDEQTLAAQITDLRESFKGNTITVSFSESERSDAVELEKAVLITEEMSMEEIEGLLGAAHITATFPPPLGISSAITMFAAYYVVDNGETMIIFYSSVKSDVTCVFFNNAPKN